MKMNKNTCCSIGIVLGDERRRESMMRCSIERKPLYKKDYTTANRHYTPDEKDVLNIPTELYHVLEIITEEID